jgi:hypothetical protein
MNTSDAFSSGEVGLWIFAVVYLIGIILICSLIYFFINRWVNRGVRVKQEQNELLRQLIRVLEKKGDTRKD